jgi:hypothetical protein
MPITIKKRGTPPTPAAVPPPMPLGPSPSRAERPKQVLARNYDSMCREVIQKHQNAIISWWLMASYAYYIHDRPLLSDGMYDDMAKQMLPKWDLYQHPHKHHITVDDLKAGSLHRLRGQDYPLQTRAAASHLLATDTGVPLNIMHDDFK